MPAARLALAFLLGMSLSWSASATEPGFYDLHHGDPRGAPVPVRVPIPMLEPPEPPAPPETLVVLLVVPGWTAARWAEAETPWADRLARRGLRVDALTTEARHPLPALATLVSGRLPREHRVPPGRWRSRVGALPRPRLWRVARERQLEVTLLGAGDAPRLLRGPEVTHFRLLKAAATSPRGAAPALAGAALEALRGGRRGLLVLVFPDLPVAAARGGDPARALRQAAGRVDGALGRLAGWARDEGLAAQVTWALVGLPEGPDQPGAGFLAGPGARGPGHAPRRPLRGWTGQLAAILAAAPPPRVSPRL